MMKFGAIPVYVKRIIIVELFILLVIVGYFGTKAGDSFIDSKDFGASEDIERSSHSGFAPPDEAIMKPFAVQGQQYHSRRRLTQTPANLTPEGPIDPAPIASDHHAVPVPLSPFAGCSRS